MSAYHHQLEMQQIELQIQKMQAEVQKLQSEAAVNVAKTQDVADVEPQLRMAELQTKMEIKQMELDLRRELAALTNQTRTGAQETQAAAKLASVAMQQAGRNTTNQ